MRGFDDSYPKKVVLLHGIWSRGGWYGHISPILEPFFTVVRIRYPQYRWYGALGVISEPWLLISSILVGWSAWNSHIHYWQVEVAIAALCCIASFHPKAVTRRQNAAAETVFAAASDHFGEPPHLIAHSFGTFLTMKLFERYLPDAEFDRVVFAGCVLPRLFPWDRVRDNRFVRHILNNHSKEDVIVRVAGIAGRLYAGLGDAGRNGFTKHVDVHDQVYNAPCALCAHGEKALVHNLSSPAFPHWRATRARSHTIRYWLPFLWGIELHEYAELRRLAGDYLTLLDNAVVSGNVVADTGPGESTEIVDFLRDFQTRSWTFFGGPIEPVFKRELGQRGVASDDLYNLCHYFLLAMGKAFRRGGTLQAKDFKRTRNLRPKYALIQAVAQFRKSKQKKNTGPV